MVLVPLGEAARQLGVSADTLRDRLRTGKQAGQKETVPPYRWLVEVGDVESAGGVSLDADERVELAVLRARAEEWEKLEALLTDQLDARTREISELHDLLQHAQLTAPSDSPGAGPPVPPLALATPVAAPRPWWAFWRSEKN